MTRPAYTATQAAALVGMSSRWLKMRIEDTPALGLISFRTGARGHWRIHPEEFDQWATLFLSGQAFVKARKHKKRAAPAEVRRYIPGEPLDLMKVFRDAQG